MNTEQVTIDTTVKVSLSRLADLLVGAFEGGSNYWYMIDGHTLATEYKVRMFPEDPKPCLYDHPVNVGGSLKIIDREGDQPAKNLLNIESLTTALKIMQEKYPEHFSNLINENDDAETSDVLLQLAIFEELIFG